MTKQQKIREGIKERLYASGCPSSLLDCEADRLMESLHSQGVVIKVEGELPNAPIPCPEPIPNDLYFYRGYEKAKEDMAGYVAVEPLIEGK